MFRPVVSLPYTPATTPLPLRTSLPRKYVRSSRAPGSNSCCTATEPHA